MSDAKISNPELIERAQAMSLRLGEIKRAVESSPFPKFYAAQSSCGLPAFKGYSHASDQVTAIREAKRDLLAGLEPFSAAWYKMQETPEYQAFVDVSITAQDLLNKWACFAALSEIS